MLSGIRKQSFFIKEHTQRKVLDLHKQSCQEDIFTHPDNKPLGLHGEGRGKSAGPL